MAAASAAAHNAIPSRRPCWNGTPEIYFTKSLDNSRLVKVEDPRRSREMKQFGIALCCLFLLVMTYAWQHFKAIEYGYKIETLKMQRDGLSEMNKHHFLALVAAGFSVAAVAQPRPAAPVLSGIDLLRSDFATQSGGTPRIDRREIEG